MSTEAQPPQPGYAPQPPANQKKGMAVAAMVLGIVGLVLAFIPVIAAVSFILCPLAVILGIIAFIKRRGRGQAITGVITGAIGVVVAIIGFALAGAFFSAVDDEIQQSQDDGGTDTDGGMPESDEDAQADAESQETEGDAAGSEGGTGDEEAAGGETFSVGDEFEVNDWLVTITGVAERTATVGDEIMNTEAQGEFLPVDLTVTNDGDSADYFFASDFVAVDNQDREYNSSSDATIYGASDGAVSLLDEINPGNSIEGRLYFDVPADAEITALDINAGFLSDPVTVSLD